MPHPPPVACFSPGGMTVKPRSCVLLTPPVVEPVSLAEVRAQLRMTSDQTDEDAFLLGAVATARRLIERRLGISLVATRYRATWPAGATVLELPNPPLLVDIAHFVTVQVDGDDVGFTVDPDLQPAEITLDASADAAVVVTYWAGAGPGQSIAPQLRSAILLYVGHLYNNREAVLTSGMNAFELPMAFETLLASESVNGSW